MLEDGDDDDGDAMSEEDEGGQQGEEVGLSLVIVVGVHLEF